MRRDGPNEQYPSAPPADRLQAEVQSDKRHGPRLDWVNRRNAMIAEVGARRAELAAAKGVIGSGKDAA